MILFTRHALTRMEERKISRAQVMGAIKQPARVIREDGSVQLFQRSYGSRRLEVVSEIGKSEIIVITVYWL